MTIGESTSGKSLDGRAWKSLDGRAWKSLDGRAWKSSDAQAWKSSAVGMVLGNGTEVRMGSTYEQGESSREEER
jgi:hypothetical protein